jgi:tripartite motif-containing protein 37
MSDPEHRGGVILQSSSDMGANEMDDLLRCFICFDRVRDAHLCPLCSSMCCKDCIVRWLTERKPQCPHCQIGLRVENLVNCRFVGDLTRAVDRLTIVKEESATGLCVTHKTELLYFCVDCDVPICADCALFTALHTGHALDKLGDVHRHHIAQLDVEIESLRNRLRDLQDVLSSIDGNVHAVRNAKDDELETIARVTRAMEMNVTKQFDTKQSHLERQRSVVHDEMRRIDSILHALSLARRAPAHDLSTVRNALVTVQRTIREPLEERDVVSDSFTSEIVPPFAVGVFRLPSFMRYRTTDAVLFSEPLESNGQTWRLKVYPNGNGIAKNVFLSIFLELTSGVAGEYEYLVKMTNEGDEDRCITRKFCSKFEPGESWGYNKFFRLDVLASDGFLYNGALQLQFAVRPPTLRLALAEQARWIASLESMVIMPPRTRSRDQSPDLCESLGEEGHHDDDSPELDDDDLTFIDVDVPPDRGPDEESIIDDADVSESDEEPEPGVVDAD